MTQPHPPQAPGSRSEVVGAGRRGLLLLGLSLAALATAAAPGAAQQPAAAPSRLQAATIGEDRIVGNLRITDSTGARQVRLQLGRAMIIELPEDARDILLSAPTVANAIVRSARRVFVIGTGVGSTNVFFFDGNGRQIAAVDVVVERDLEGLNRMLRRLFPSTNVRAEAISENVIVSGQVNSPADAKMAIEVAERFVGQLSGQASTVTASGGGAASTGPSAASGSGSGAGTAGSGSRIVNALTIAGKDQVQLRVVVAEMDRRAIHQIGVNLQGNWAIGNNRVQFNQNNPFPVNAPSAGLVPGNNTATPNPPWPINAGSAGGLFSGIFPGDFATQVDLRALEQTGLIRTLAEPTVTAISGEAASFLAGGEFPVPVGRDRDGNITIEFKQFGVGLAFTPVVLSEGRISLRLRTEVSEIDPSAGYTGAGGFVIPGLAVRRADSTLELPSGGTLVLAGLIRDQTRRAVSGIPGLRRIPVLGRLFSSQDFQQSQSELVILVTPYVVNPVARRDLALPTDGFVNASDPEALLFNRLNSIYGVRGQSAPTQRPNGRFGFIYE